MLINYFNVQEIITFTKSVKKLSTAFMHNAVAYVREASKMRKDIFLVILKSYLTYPSLFMYISEGVMAYHNRLYVDPSIYFVVECLTSTEGIQTLNTLSSWPILS